MALNFKSNATALDSLYATWQDIGFAGGRNIFSWGAPTYGSLGLNSEASNISSPAVIGSSSTWSITSTHLEHSLALKTDGSLWAWGYNNAGQVGKQANINYSSPVQVGTFNNWSRPVAGRHHSMGVKSDGTLWTWGRNNYGQLGINNSVYFTTTQPQQIGTETTWSSVGGALSGAWHVLAIKTNGTLWSWGYNNVGPLGQNDTNNRSSPVQVGTNTNWSFVVAGRYSSWAIKTDGTLWAWGFNNFGQLGLNDIVNYSSPVQVGTNTNWSKLNTGNHDNPLAVKTDGTLWAWGRNAFGQLGLNNTYNYSSPVQVGSGTNWSLTSSGRYHSIALKTDGTLWAWGRNSKGQLGQNNTTYRSSPVQIGTLTTWSNIQAGFEQSFAVTNPVYLTP